VEKIEEEKVPGAYLYKYTNQIGPCYKLPDGISKIEDWKGAEFNVAFASSLEIVGNYEVQLVKSSGTPSCINFDGSYKYPSMKIDDLELGRFSSFKSAKVTESKIKQEGVLLSYTDKQNKANEKEKGITTKFLIPYGNSNCADWTMVEGHRYFSFKDKMPSIEIIGKYKVTLYEEENGRGNSLEIMGNIDGSLRIVNNLKIPENQKHNKFCGKVASIKVEQATDFYKEPGVYLYPYKDCLGEGVRIPDGESSYEQWGNDFMNTKQTASCAYSVEIVGNYHVVLYNSLKMKKEFWVCEGSNRVYRFNLNEGSIWNFENQVNSAKIEKLDDAF